MLVFFKRLAFVVSLVLLVIFGFQNAGWLSQTSQFTLDLRFWKYQSPDFPLFILLGVSFLLGMLAAGAHGAYEWLARRADIRRRERRIRALEEEVAMLRSQLAELRPGPVATSPASVQAPAPSPNPDHTSRIAPPSPPSEREPTL